MHLFTHTTLIDREELIHALKADIIDELEMTMENEAALNMLSDESLLSILNYIVTQSRHYIGELEEVLSMISTQDYCK